VLCLAQRPLHRLQKLRGWSTSDQFLYDDSFLHDHVSRSTLRAHGDAIELKPGVALCLARLAGLLKPALEIMWVDDVRRMNKFLGAEVPDVAGHLFGRDRAALTAVRQPFKEAFGPHCFYCRTHLPANNPIDHVLPWSLVGIDGLSNLVLACARCNGDKSGALPAVGIVDRVLRRERDVLEEIASALQWPTQHERVVAAARGIYRGQPARVRHDRATRGPNGWTSAFFRGGCSRIHDCARLSSFSRWRTGVGCMPCRLSGGSSRSSTSRSRRPKASLSSKGIVTIRRWSFIHCVSRISSMRAAPVASARMAPRVSRNVENS
jgi:5-methylcytosine-specific restriction endonuclease McrA